MTDVQDTSETTGTWLDATGQRWKVRAAGVASVVQVASGLTLFLSHSYDVVSIALVIQIASLALLALSVVSVKCKVCDEYVMVTLLKQDRTRSGRCGGCARAPTAAPGAKPTRSADLRARRRRPLRTRGRAPPPPPRYHECVRRRVAVALAVIAVALGAAVGSGRLDSREKGLDLAPAGDRSLTLAGCDDEGVWVVASERPDAGTVKALGVAGALAVRRSSLVRSGSSGDWNELQVGRGSVFSVSVADDGSVWLILVEDTPTTGRGSRILMKDKGRSEWRGVETPPGVSGLAFQTQLDGWAWSSTTVYRTIDGGHSWRGELVEPWKIQEAWSGGRPRLGPSGELWVPLQQETSPLETILVTFDRHVRRREVAAWTGATLDAMGVDGEGRAMVAVHATDGSEFHLEHVTAAGGRRGQPLLTRARASPSELHVWKSASVLETIEGPWPTGFFGRIPTSEWVSVDAGKTWARRSTTGEGASAYCATASGYWTLSESRKKAIFRGWPAVREAPRGTP